MSLSQAWVALALPIFSLITLGVGSKQVAGGCSVADCWQGQSTMLQDWTSSVSVWGVYVKQKILSFHTQILLQWSLLDMLWIISNVASFFRYSLFFFHSHRENLCVCVCFLGYLCMSFSHLRSLKNYTVSLPSTILIPENGSCDSISCRHVEKYCSILKMNPYVQVLAMNFQLLEKGITIWR